MSPTILEDAVIDGSVMPIGYQCRNILWFVRGAAWEVIANVFAGSVIIPRVLRGLIYRLVGMDVAATASICPRVYFQSWRTRIGAASFINTGVRFYCGQSLVVLGDCVHVAMGVSFVTETHDIGPPNCRRGGVLSKPIIVGDGCWIGANALVLSGVKIGAGCVIGAGAVVVGECLPNGLYAGIPARRLRDLSVDERPRLDALSPGLQAGANRG